MASRESKYWRQFSAQIRPHQTNLKLCEVLK